MEDVLKRLFQADILFPPTAGREAAMGRLGEDLQREEARISTAVDRALWEDYLERQERAREEACLLAFENGFLLATALWWEASCRWEAAP